MEVEGCRGEADVRMGRVTGAIIGRCEDDEGDGDDDEGDNDDDDSMCLFGSSPLSSNAPPLVRQTDSMWLIDSPRISSVVPSVV